MAELKQDDRNRTPKGKNRRFSYSLTTVSIVVAVVLLVVTLLVVGSVSYYYQTKFKDQYLAYTVRLQSQFNSDTAADFKTLDLQLFQLGEYNTNISLINSTPDDQTFYRAKMSLYRELSNLAPVFPKVEGLFFYSPLADDYTPFIARSSTAECSSHIRH